MGSYKTLLKKYGKIHVFYSLFSSKTYYDAKMAKIK
jgi:hypothetical protein